MPKSLRGKLVLVTGASAGIGRATTEAFAREGARVLAVARSRDRLDELSRNCGGEASVVPLAADVADAAAMEALAADVLARFGVPDVIVANAGAGLDARFVATTDDMLRRVFEVNVFGVVRTIRPFLPGMLARASGRILVVSSVVGKRGTPNYSAYSGSKFALHGIVEALRPEILGSGVTVGIVCPSSTETEFDAKKVRSGPPQRRVRVQRHSSESVARAIVRMAGSRRREMVLSPEGKFLAVVSRLAPGLVDRVLARALVGKD